MSDWEESKQNFIDKLSNADRIFDEIFKTDSEGFVIQGEEREELENLQAANKKILNSKRFCRFSDRQEKNSVRNIGAAAIILVLILRDITAKAVINAIGLERAFNSVITKNVNLINRHLQEREGNAAYRAWIRNNAAKLMPSHFEQIIEQGAVRENKKAIVNAVKNLLSKWD